MAKQPGRKQSPTFQKPIDAYDYSYQTRNLEIKLFWQRSNYFLVLNTAIAGGIFFQGLKINPVSILLAAFGVLVSILWYGVNLGSKFWQTRWEQKLSDIEEKLSPDIHLFNIPRSETSDDVKKGLDASGKGPYRQAIDSGVLTKPSVSRNMIALSLLFAVFYTSMLVYALFTVCR